MGVKIKTKTGVNVIVRMEKARIMGTLQKIKKRFGRTEAEDQVPPSHRPDEQYLTPCELSEFRGVLLQRHAELLQDAVRMSTGLSESDSDVSPQLLEHSQRVMTEIEEALRRIQLGILGVCEDCGHRIAKPRLLALPWARRCFECATNGYPSP